MTTRRGFLIAGGAFAALPALAHRSKRTETWLEWREDELGGYFEITHIFHRHDTESALAAAGMIETPESDSLRTRALVAIHVEETFGIEGVELETLGAETEGNRLYVYQVAQMDALPESLTVRAAMLRNLWGDQTNAVDVKIDGDVRSLRFAGADGAKTVALP